MISSKQEEEKLKKEIGGDEREKPQRPPVMMFDLIDLDLSDIFPSVKYEKSRSDHRGQRSKLPENRRMRWHHGTPCKEGRSEPSLNSSIPSISSRLPRRDSSLRQ